MPMQKYTRAESYEAIPADEVKEIKEAKVFDVSVVSDPPEGQEFKRTDDTDA